MNMANDSKKYLELDGLKQYDTKIKAWAMELDEPIDKDIVTNNTVGGLKEGTSISKDKKLASIICDMLVSVKDAEYGSKPSCKITNTGTTAGEYEVGTTINTNLSGTYTDGTFKSYKSGSNTETESINAGCESAGYKYTKNSAEYSDSSFVLAGGANTITLTYSYTASTVKAKKSDGSDSTIKYDAGTCSNSLTWTGYYKYYEGAIDSIPDTINREFAEDSLKKAAYTSSLKYDTTMNKRAYAVLIPEKKTIEVKDNKTGADLSGRMKSSEVTIVDAAGRDVKYYMYTCSFDTSSGLGDNSITITFK